MKIICTQVHLPDVFVVDVGVAVVVVLVMVVIGEVAVLGVASEIANVLSLMFIKTCMNNKM